MNARSSLAGVWLAAAASLCVAAAPAGGAGAQCGRACLDAIAEQYLSAMVVHDPSRAPFRGDVRYTEDGVELTLPDGLWRTASAVEKYRLFVDDPQMGEVAFFSKVRENGAPVLLATRLRVIDGKITEAEAIAARQGDLFPGPGSAGSRTHVDELGEAPRPQFLQTIPEAKRLSRQQLMDIANAYFTGLEGNTGDKPPPFADDCRRLENGTQTTSRPTPAGQEPGAANLSCREAFDLGYYHEDGRIRNRRILAVDRERGLVYAGGFWDHDATVRSYELKNGRSVSVARTAPWTWMANEIFQVTPEGRISQVEAVLLGVPYGMRPGWATGTPMESPQAIKDHFREY